LFQAVPTGDLFPAEAADISKAVNAYVRAIQATNLNECLLPIEPQATR
jgi:hypothetical protein